MKTIAVFTPIDTPNYRDLPQFHALPRGTRLAIRQHAKNYVASKSPDWRILSKQFKNHTRLKREMTNAYIVANTCKIPVSLEFFTILPRGVRR